VGFRNYHTRFDLVGQTEKQKTEDWRGLQKIQKRDGKKISVKMNRKMDRKSRKNQNNKILYFGKIGYERGYESDKLFVKAKISILTKIF
jgi:hypothetical protein